MDDALRALDRNPDLVVTVRYGTEHFGAGLVTVRLHGDGRVEVEQLQSGTAHRDQLTLSAARVAGLGKQLADHHFTASRTTKLPREPGDTPLLLELRRADAILFSADLWYADRYHDADLDGVIRIADALMHEATGGRLGQPDPGAGH